MDRQILENVGFLQEILDAIPAMLLIVDNDVQILHLNATASSGLGLDIRDVHHKRGGEALHCVHATDVPGGCGRGPACRECIIRNAVTNAVQGNKTYRKATRMKLVNNSSTTELQLLITASPFKFEEKSYILLTLENISELIRLKSLLPICMHCKKIRNDEGYWNNIAVYFNTQLDVEFSHGLCEECLVKFYPQRQKQ